MGVTGTASFFATFPSESSFVPTALHLDPHSDGQEMGLPFRINASHLTYLSVRIPWLNLILSLAWNSTEEWVSNANAFFNEFVTVAILIVLILAIGDSTNVPPPAGLNPIILMFMITALGLSLGIQTSCESSYGVVQRSAEEGRVGLAQRC